MKASIKKCLIVEWVDFPRNIKDIVADWHGFHNDCIVPLRSDFTAKDFREGMKCIENYWKDQSDNNDFKGTLQEFIKEYGLDFEIWFIKQKFDLTDVDEILIKVCW